MIEKCEKFMINLNEYGMIPIRLAVGTIFIAHGAQKLFGVFGGSGLAATIEAFRSYMGIPAALAVIAASTEFFGGIAILVGFLTRLAALGLSVVMLVALVKVHWANGFFLNWFNLPTKGHGIEYNLALLGACLGLVFSGARGLALDKLFLKSKLPH